MRARLSRPATAAIAALLLLTGERPALAQAHCSTGSQGLGVARIVEVDATGGPVFGSITKRQREERFLGPKEVVLTFDDGPMPGVTRPILDTLDRFCTKATFFSVGKMAIAYPELIREIIKRGHTLGTHTWSHPMSLPRLRPDQARDQIESGFAAAVMAAGGPIAPFFRFPGLNDSGGLVAHLEKRNIATFTVDVVSNDSYIVDPARLIERTLREVETENGGIMLFHDIKPQTARALPAILSELKTRGFKVVHLVAKAPFEHDARYVAAVRDHLAQRNPSSLRTLAAFTEPQPAPAAAVPAATLAETQREPVQPGRERIVAPAQPPAAWEPAAPKELATAESQGASTRPPRPDTRRADIPLQAARPTAPARSGGSAASIVQPTAPAQVSASTAVAPTVPARPSPPQTSASSFEVVAGAYGNGLAPSGLAPAAAQPAAAIAPPAPAAHAEVIAGSYGPAVRRDPSWTESLSRRMQENGN